jgi:hypothetical protein
VTWRGDGMTAPGSRSAARSGCRIGWGGWVLVGIAGPDGPHR